MPALSAHEFVVICFSGPPYADTISGRGRAKCAGGWSAGARASECKDAPARQEAQPATALPRTGCSCRSRGTSERRKREPPAASGQLQARTDDCSELVALLIA